MEETSLENSAAKCSPITTSQGPGCWGCRPKAHRKRKYVFTAQIDQLIREIYLNQPDTKSRPGIRVLAKKVGMPHWVLRKRARELGLARTKEKPWSDAELEILARYAWMRTSASA